MEYVSIGYTGLKGSRIGLGTFAIGGLMWGGSDERTSMRTVNAAFEHGINLIDTAPTYGFGISEEIVGKVIAERGNRENVIIATKVGLEASGGEIFRNSTKEEIFRTMEGSLKRLRTNYIDICQVHWPDPLVPIEETAAAMNQLYERGKIRAIGVSNYSPEQMECFRKVAPLHTAQPPYNLFERCIERNVLPYCRKHKITMLTYGSLCRGLLTGKMRPDTKFSGDDLRKTDPKFQTRRYEQYLKTVELLDGFAQENYGKGVIHLAVRWLLDRTVDGIALWGARRPEQLDTIGEVWGWTLDAKALEVIDEIIDRNIKQPIPTYVSESFVPSCRS